MASIDHGCNHQDGRTKERNKALRKMVPHETQRRTVMGSRFEGLDIEPVNEMTDVSPHAVADCDVGSAGASHVVKQSNGRGMAKGGRDGSMGTGSTAERYTRNKETGEKTGLQIGMEIVGGNKIRAPTDSRTQGRHQRRGRGGLMGRGTGTGGFSTIDPMLLSDVEEQEDTDGNSNKLILLSSLNQEERDWKDKPPDNPLALVLSGNPSHQRLVQTVHDLLERSFEEEQRKSEMMDLEEPPDPGGGMELEPSQTQKSKLSVKRVANADVHTQKKGRIDRGDPNKTNIV
ncbi:hypothetical protein J5N97_018221 [Dioscorea zingiberensis]|uniref:Uncharacterized protein n=1 Tax=Dioscorea zingiberensis TaxID=325984 RepID=A0A9D5CMT5_9LILI|nr:hypothetical protein J5N97_018221 [Dioscorea zingiberensis]